MPCPECHCENSAGDCYWDPDCCTNTGAGGDATPSGGAGPDKIIQKKKISKGGVPTSTGNEFGGGVGWNVISDDDPSPHYGGWGPGYASMASCLAACAQMNNTDHSCMDICRKGPRMKGIGRSSGKAGVPFSEQVGPVDSGITGADLDHSDGMKVQGNYYTQGQASGNQHFSSGVNRIDTSRKNKITKRSKFLHGNPHSRKMNNLSHPRSRNEADKKKKIKRLNSFYHTNPTLMRGNDPGHLKHDLVYYTYVTSGKRYLGNQQYQRGGGNWYVDDKYGKKQELKQHTVTRNVIAPQDLNSKDEIGLRPGTREFDNWVQSFNHIRGCQCQRVNWWSGHYNRHCVGAQCASPGAACFGNLNPCAVSKDGKDTFTLGNYTK